MSLSKFKVGSHKRPDHATMIIMDPDTGEATSASMVLKSPYTKDYKKAAHKVDQLRAAALNGVKFDNDGVVVDMNFAKMIADTDFDTIVAIEHAQLSLALAVTINWSGFYDDDDNELSFSQKALKQVLTDIDWLPAQIQEFCADADNFTKKVTKPA